VSWNPFGNTTGKWTEFLLAIVGIPWSQIGNPHAELGTARQNEEVLRKRFS
jgi:hypothetical protein